MFETRTSLQLHDAYACKELALFYLLTLQRLVLLQTDATYGQVRYDTGYIDTHELNNAACPT